MRLLIDQDISGGTAALLRALGHDAVSAFEIGMGRSPDPMLIEFALNDDRVLATLDSDHHQIIAVGLLSKPSVILLREKSPSARTASDLIHRVCSRYEDQLLSGCMLTCTVKSVRIRKIPLGKS